MKSCGLFRKGERYKFNFGLKAWIYKKKGEKREAGFYGGPLSFAFYMRFSSREIYPHGFLDGLFARKSAHVIEKA